MLVLGVSPVRKRLTIRAYVVESWQAAVTNTKLKVHLLTPSKFPTAPSHLGVHVDLDATYWTDLSELPFRDGSMDSISSRSLQLLLRSSQWPAFLQECTRVLRPGGALEVSILDPIPRNCGTLLREWTTKNVLLGLEKRYLLTHPTTMVIPLWLKDIAELEHLSSVKFTFAAATDWPLFSSSPATPTAASDQQDNDRLRTAVGRHFYRSLYKKLLAKARQGQGEVSPRERQGITACSWWWQESSIVNECIELGAAFEMITFRCRKRR